MSQPSIEQSVRANLQTYFDDLGDQTPHALHEMVLAATERPLFEFVLARCKGNQSKAAAWLGINRNTLHKKLTHYGIH